MSENFYKVRGCNTYQISHKGKIEILRANGYNYRAEITPFDSVKIFIEKNKYEDTTDSLNYSFESRFYEIEQKSKTKIKCNKLLENHREQLLTMLFFRYLFNKLLFEKVIKIPAQFFKDAN